ncbi:response regulator [Clostridium felsineum]|uniref:response regulator n=1 Tax=Clostridium felsineum TaxID=36839 RepID=UPI00098C974F|nr:response regulator [Clostridium felsineum]URZ01838.1 Protein-glutamate methylesterase/protein-glutamine glutaminase [Clostridium felsineum]
MNNIRIVIVDDSPFSISVLSGMLEKNGFNVVGSASNLKEVKEVVEELKPDLVTMDMVLADTDGLECTRVVHEIDPNIRVIAVSSMMDDEIIAQAKKTNISAYIQKPIDEEELVLAINRISANDDLYQELKERYCDIFKQAFTFSFNNFIKEIPKFTDIEKEERKIEHVENGISIVMAIIGKYCGRLIITLTNESAGKFVEKILKRPAKDSQEILNVVAEFGNIVGGNACSMINRENKLFGVRIAPPTTIYGESINISRNSLDAMSFFTVTFAAGEINVNIGFNKGAVEWMSNI